VREEEIKDDNEIIEPTYEDETNDVFNEGKKFNF